MERANLDALLRSVTLKGSRERANGWRQPCIKRILYYFRIIFFEMGEITSYLYADVSHPMDVEKWITWEERREILEEDS